jgi:hypothetical protein
MAIELPSSATNAVSSTNRLLSGSGVVSGLQNKAGELLKNVSNLLSGAGNGLRDLTSGTPGQFQEFIDYSTQAQEQNIVESIERGTSIVQIDAVPPFSNILHRYASYNYIWTMWVLRPYDLNFPDVTYRKGVTGDIILKSGSGDFDNRIPLTNYVSKTSNPSGKFEFYIDNVRIGGLIGLDKNTGNTNANSISFRIIEPYSMGLFFQTLQAAVAKTGYKAWNNIPIMLRLEFTGHLDQYNLNVKVPQATKYFPLKIMNISMKVSGNGSSYDCTAIPWNERAYSTAISSAPNPVAIEGKTVQEMLQSGPKSLQYAINFAQKKKAENANIPVSDQVLILFPLDPKTAADDAGNQDTGSPPGAKVDPSSLNTVNQNLYRRLGIKGELNPIQEKNVNTIGTSTMGFGDLQRAKQSFGEESEVYDEKAGVFKRGSIKIQSDQGVAEFAQGSNIPNMINQVILVSEYGRQALENTDEYGFVPWWRVESQLYLLDSDSNLAVTGNYATLAVYRVVPTAIHCSRFLPIEDRPKGVEELKKVALKEYNYIYTSKNLDIIDFNIEFNNGFYKQLTVDMGKRNQGVITKSQSGSDATSDTNSDGGTQPSASTQATPPTDATVFNNDSITVGSNKSPVGDDNPGTLAAKAFNDAINSMVDMVQLDLKILGDPYYLGDSNMGNYSAQKTSLRGINADGAIDGQSTEVYINVNFRNPIDIDYTTGLYEFGQGKVVPQFSGLYRVGEVQNEFNGGTFIQSLKLMKMPNQNTDKADAPTNGKTLVDTVKNTPVPSPEDANSEAPESDGETTGYENVEGGP